MLLTQVQKDALAVLLFGYFAYLCIHTGFALWSPWQYSMILGVVVVCAIIDAVYVGTRRPTSVACAKDMLGTVSLASVAAYMAVVGRERVDGEWLAVFFIVAAFLDTASVVAYCAGTDGDVYAPRR